MKLAVRRLSVGEALMAASGVSVVLYLVGALANNGSGYYYLVWNLFLAWLPLGFVYFLLKILRNKLWSSWPALALTFLWLIFLPNSFYMISDFVHLAENPAGNVMYDVVLLASFSFNGLVIGYLSLVKIHQQLIVRRHGANFSLGLIGLALLASSYAIYLGRVIRLNSWDFFTNFVGVLYSVSDEVLHPSDYPAVIGVTLSFFALLAMMYLVVWRFSGYNLTNERGTRR